MRSFLHRSSGLPIPIKRVVALVFVVGCFLYVGLHSRPSKSANLGNVSDTLSTGRFSWVGRLGSGNAVGSAIVNIDGTANLYESTSSANLFVGDQVAIGNGALMGGLYTVSGILSNTQLEVTPVLGSANATAGMFVIATSSASHTIAFTTTSAVANGSFRVLIPAVSNTVTARDGLPDRNGFDFGTAAVTVTCPTDVGSTYDFTAGTASASNILVGSTYYHAFECRYSGAGSNSQALTGFTVANLINPAPNSGHVDGTADSYKIIVQQMDATKSTVIDQTTAAVAVIESVRVTATVDPQITFRIMGVGSGVSTCGVVTNVVSTSTAIPFGSVALGSFSIGSQALSVSTNATNGFAVTLEDNDSLGRGGNACHVAGGGSTGNPCIPDSPGDTGSMTYAVTSAWTDATKYGFGMTVALPAAQPTVTLGFTNYKDVANNIVTAQSPQTLFSSATVAANANIYACYKLTISPTQQAGDYSNFLTYRATATF